MEEINGIYDNHGNNINPDLVWILSKFFSPFQEFFFWQTKLNQEVLCRNIHHAPQFIIFHLTMPFFMLFYNSVMELRLRSNLIVANSRDRYFGISQHYELYVTNIT
jgi:hypothetical protein